jgi:hypothetical protein
MNAHAASPFRSFPAQVRVIALMLSVLLLHGASQVFASDWKTIASLDATAVALLHNNVAAIVVGGASVWSVNINSSSHRYKQVTTIAQNSNADYEFTAVAVNARGTIAYVTANTLAYDANQQLQGRLYSVHLRGANRGTVQQLIGDTDFAFTGIAIADRQIFITGAQVSQRQLIGAEADERRQERCSLLPHAAAVSGAVCVSGGVRVFPVAGTQRAAADVVV